MILRFKTALFALLLTVAGVQATPRATVTWTGAGDGTSWNDTGNWDTGTVPSFGDDVVIDLAGTNTITLNVSANLNSLSLSGANTLLMQQNLALASASSIGGSARLEWNSGNLSGTGTLTNAGLVESVGATNKTLIGLTVVNDGTLRISGSGNIDMNQSDITNNALVDLAADGGEFNLIGGAPTLTNAASGTIRKSAGAGATNIDIAIDNQGGTIGAQSGSLILTRSGTINGGQLEAGAGARLQIAITYTFSGTVTGNPSGEVVLVSTGTVSVPVAATVNFGGTGLRWEAGTISGVGTLTNAGLIDAFGASNKTLSGATLVNDGTLRISGSGNINVNQSDITNNALIDLAADGGELNLIGGAPTLTNAASGTIRKSAGAGAAVIDVAIDNQGGTIAATSGTLQLTRASTYADATLSAPAGAVLVFSGGTHTVSGTISGTPAGAIQLVSSATITVPTTATLNVAGTGFEWQSGTVSGAGTLTNAGLLVLPGATNKTLTSVTLANTGTLQITGSGSLLMNGSALTNSSLVELAADGGDIDFSANSPTLTNEATGTVRKSAGVGVTVVDVPITNQGGTIEAQSGTLDITRGGTFATTTLGASAGATLSFSGPAPTVTGTVSGTPAGRIAITTGIEVTAAGTVDIAGTGLEWPSGTISGGGTLTNAGLLVLPGATNKTLTSATLANTGTLRITGSGNLFLNGSTLTNSGLVDLSADSGDIDFSANSPTMTNEAAGTVRASLAAGTAIIDVPLANAGLIEAESGTLSFTRSLDHQDGGVIAGSATFDPPVTITHDGDTAPGSSPGVLTWAGPYAPSANAELVIEIQDTSGPGTGHDQLAVTGAATLAGTLDVTLPGTVSDGDSFVILTAAGGVSGTFSSPNVLYIGSGFIANVVYNANDVTLNVEQIDADYAVTKTVSSPTVVQGGQVTFTVTARNLGPDDETAIPVSQRPSPVLTFSDPAPTGVTFDTVTESAGTYTAGTWSLDGLPVSNTAGETLTIVATVNGIGHFTNTVSLASNEFVDTAPGNNTASASVFSPPTYDAEIIGTLVSATQYDATIRIKTNDTDEDLGTSTFSLTFNDDALTYSSVVFANFDAAMDADYAAGAVTVTPDAGNDRLDIDVTLTNADQGTVVPAGFIDVATLTFTITDPAQTAGLAWAAAQTEVQDGDNTNTWLQGNLIGNNGALPVEWTAFDAVVDGQDVVLTWETATETDNAGFTVERVAFDVAGEWGAGSGWSEVGFVEGAGTTVEAQRYAFRLTDQAIGRHQFRLRQVDFSGEVSYSDVVEVVVEVPGAYVLSDAYPNPFNPQATFTLAVAERQRVTVDLFDALGRSVQTLHEGELAANQTHRFTLDGSRLPSGVYLYRVAGESFVESRRVTLVK